MVTNADNYAVMRDKIETEMSDLGARRQELINEFGSVFYEATKDDPDLREKHEALYGRIEAVDRRREELREQIAEMDAEAAKAQLRANPVDCPRCGREIRVDDSFCSGCGVAADTAREEAARQIANAQTVMMPIVQAPLQPTCPQCGANVGMEDRFCMKCGQPLGPAAGSAL